MFDISFHINLFISLIEVEHPLKTWNKITHIALSISLIEVEHPLKMSNERTHTALPIYFFSWSRISIKNIKWKNTRVNLKEIK